MSSVSPVRLQFSPRDLLVTVTINFDELPEGTRVVNQYSPRVRFSATNYNAGEGGSQWWDLYASSYPPPFNLNKALDPVFNPYHNYPGPANFYMDFGVPVNNVSFTLLNIGNSLGAPLAYVEIYRNHLPYLTITLPIAVNQYTTLPVSLTGVTAITDIGITTVSNNALLVFPNSYPIPLYLDNISFTPDMNVTISSSRITGPLNGTQKAMVGADIVLDTTLSPSGRTGGPIFLDNDRAIYFGQ